MKYVLSSHFINEKAHVYRGHTTQSHIASKGSNQNSHQGYSYPILDIVSENGLKSPRRSLNGNTDKNLRLELTSRYN